MNTYSGNKTNLLRNRKRKLEKKVFDLESVVRQHVSQSVGESTLEDLCKKASKVTAAFMTSVSKKIKFAESANNHPREAYSQDMRQFSLSLHNISPSAYRYIRENMEYALPDESTLRRWMCRIDCSPGLQLQEKNISFSKSITIF